MHLTVSSRRSELTPSIREHVRDRLTAALDQHASRVRRVTVLLEDVNGPRGGEDQLCRVAVELNDGQTLHHEPRGFDLYANVSLVADKVKRRVGGVIAKVRRHRS